MQFLKNITKQRTVSTLKLCNLNNTDIIIVVDGIEKLKQTIYWQ